MKTYLVERTDGGVSVTRLLNKKTRKGERTEMAISYIPTRSSR
jgi:hypothetical protein